MLKSHIIFFLTLLIIITGCTEPELTPTATVVVLPNPTATVPPTAPSVPTPAPATIGRWQCDPSGGLACYDNLLYVTMLNAEEGWATGEDGTVLHYTTALDGTPPAWRRSSSSEVIPFYALSMISPTEGWGATHRGVIHYNKGVWQEIPLPEGGVSDIVMLNPHEGWAVASDGFMYHYTEGQWQTIQVLQTETYRDLAAIAMVNPEEGWLTLGSNCANHRQQL